nr:zinc ribbon domain-containing protein [Candidatus Njordarchaeota archaeon]
MPYCNKCGAKLGEGNEFCTQCGQQVAASVEMAQPKESGLQGTSATGEERYLGGIIAPRPAMKGLSWRLYEIHATTRRIIGVRNKRATLRLVGAVLGGVAGIGLIAARGRDLSANTIAQLEEKKTFEVWKEEISEMEAKKPTFTKAGYVNIALNSGENIRFSTPAKGDFEKIRNLRKVVYPERLKVLE